jgi:hypothetical protein
VVVVPSQMIRMQWGIVVVVVGGIFTVVVVVGGLVVVVGGGEVVVGGAPAVVVVAPALVVVVLDDDFFFLAVVVVVVLDDVVEDAAGALVVVVLDDVEVEATAAPCRPAATAGGADLLGEWNTTTAMATNTRAAPNPSSTPVRRRWLSASGSKTNSSWTGRGACPLTPGSEPRSAHVPSSSICRRVFPVLAGPNAPFAPSPGGQPYKAPELRPGRADRRSMTRTATPLGGGGVKALRGKGRPRRTV